MLKNHFIIIILKKRKFYIYLYIFINNIIYVQNYINSYFKFL